MKAKHTTYGFGVDPMASTNHFYVLIPQKQDEPVQIYERYGWTDGDEQVIERSDVLRIEISRHKWNLVNKDLTLEFNVRLKKEKHKFSCAFT